MSAPDDCTRCGACCLSENPRHVRVWGEDYARLGDDAENAVTWLGNEAYVRLAPLSVAGVTVSACASLRIEPESGRLLCSVYERRPQTCRELERGSGACAGEREQKEARTTRLLRVLRSA